MPIALSIKGKTVDCATQGNPESEHVFLTIGPGSLYLPLYSDTLKQHAHFVAYDEPWIHKKGSTANSDAIKLITLESLVDDIRSAVVNLKAIYPGKKIHLLANSIVTGLALSCAQNIEGIDSTLCIGTPLKPIQADFAHAKANLSRDEIAQFENDIALFNDMLLGKRLDEKLPDSNVESGRLTPNSEFVEQCQSLRVAALKDYQRYDKVITYMWRHTPDSAGHVLNLAMRAHFFDEIQAAINAPNILDSLNAGKAKVFLAWGKADGITPYDVELLKNWPNIQQCIFANTGHFPQLEGGQAFDEAILNFVGQNHENRTHRKPRE